MTPFHFLIVLLVLRTWLEIWYHGDMCMVLYAKIEANAAANKSPAWLWEALLCTFCHPHHAGVILAGCTLAVEHADNLSWLLAPQAVAFGWAAGYIAWAADEFLPYPIRYMRERNQQ